MNNYPKTTDVQMSSVIEDVVWQILINYSISQSKWHVNNVNLENVKHESNVILNYWKRCKNLPAATDYPIICYSKFNNIFTVTLVHFGLFKVYTMTRNFVDAKREDAVGKAIINGVVINAQPW